MPRGKAGPARFSTADLPKPSELNSAQVEIRCLVDVDVVAGNDALFFWGAQASGGRGGRRVET